MLHRAGASLVSVILLTWTSGLASAQDSRPTIDAAQVDTIIIHVDGMS